MRTLWIAIAAVLLTLPALGVASPIPPPPLPAASRTDLQRILDAQIESNPGSGIVVGIIDHGKTTILTAGSSGTSRPLDEHSLFEIGSVTKTFTATILADMVLHHKLALTDPVQRFLPTGITAPTRDSKSITLLSLATQHSGLPREVGSGRFPGGGPTWDQLLAFLNTYTLTRDPGQSFEYSNFGVSLLGAALADAENATYPALVQTRIFDRLGMKETSAYPIADLSPSLRARLTEGHGVEGTLRPDFQADAYTPAGGIRSSVSDMLRFVRCSLGQGPLAAACLFAQRPRDTFPGYRIGLIWWTGDFVPIISHGGDTLGFHACVAISPDHQRGVVVLTNGSTAAEAIAQHVIDPSLSVAQPVNVTLSSHQLDAYAGTYHNMSNGVGNQIAHSRDGLTMQVDGTPRTLRMYALGGDRFFRPFEPAELMFTRNPAGDVNGIQVYQLPGNRTVVYVRDGQTLDANAPRTLPPSITLAASDLKQYAGTYILDAGTAFTVALGGESGLILQRGSQRPQPLHALAKDHFYLTDPVAQIDFTRDAKGKVIALVSRQFFTVTAMRK
jgi:serine-type D-Ala-D-Ala carboxypeptidase/endopeptidase